VTALTIQILAVAAAIVIPARLAWAQIDLSWGDCGINGIQDLSWACNANLSTTAAPKLYVVASFHPPVSPKAVIGLEGLIRWTSDQPNLVPWWQYGNEWIDSVTTGPAGCRANDMAARFDASQLNAGSPICFDYFGPLSPVGGSLTYYGLPNSASGQARVQVAVPFDQATALDPTTETYAFWLAIDKLKTIGSGSCSGCSTPMVLFLDYLTVFYTDNTSITLTEPLHRNFITWQGGPPNSTITASAGGGGTISPSGGVVVPYTGKQTFTITAAPCSQLIDVLVDGASVGAVTSYTFSDVRGNHTIVASFQHDVLGAGSGLVGWWPGDGDASDVAGVHNGTPAGGVGFAAGRVGQAFRLDGVDDYVANLGDASTFSFIENTGVFTIESWIKLDDPSASIQQAITAQTGATADKGHFFIWENLAGHRRLRLGIVRGISGSPTIDVSTSDDVITDNGWHHVAAVGDGSNVTFYVDGNRYGPYGPMGPKPSGNATRSMDLGRCPSTSPECQFHGSIDEPAVYNRALSTAEIRAIYKAGLAGTCRCVDLDQDGHVSSACGIPGDCDDNDPNIHPGALDRTCNGVDENCSGVADEGVSGCVCVENGPGLVGWWRGNGNANDLVAGNNGTLTNGATASAGGEVGQAFSFDGVDDYVANLGGVSTFSFIEDTGVFTIDAWIKLNDPGIHDQQAITAHTATSADKGHFFIWENSAGAQQLRLAIMRGVSGQPTIDSHSPNNVITTNGWHHVAAVGNGTKVTFYVDGAPYDGTGTIGIKPTGDATRVVDIGRCPAASTECPFAGQIDEVQIYNRALSAAEIQAIYNTGSAGMCGLGAVAVDPSSSPHGVRFGRPWPNPSVTSMSLQLELPVRAMVTAEVVDVSGRRVAILLDGASFTAGAHRVTWDGRDAAGRHAAPGVYMMRVSAGSASTMSRIIRLE
jgi:hypothetical protein